MQNRFFSNLIYQAKEWYNQKNIADNQPNTTAFVNGYINLYQIPNFCDVSQSQSMIICHDIDFLEKYYNVHH